MAPNQQTRALDLSTYVRRQNRAVSAYIFRNF